MILDGPAVMVSGRQARFHWTKESSEAIIPSLTVEQKKTLQTQYLYGLAAVFLLSRTIVIYSFPLLFF